ncbi:MAG: hypothetical protein KGR98_07640 [Verrucomicrobia bacterium]|nr:hypothetical protein [Verrucomicrobiota bacterium]MDE3100082.1 hypothetical protein [Verrucomicrobiota bacterium]
MRKITVKTIGGLKDIKIIGLLCLGCASLALSAPAQTAQTGQMAPLTAGKPVLLPGTHGGFDFIQVDQRARRLLLAHEGNKTLDVVDLASGKFLKSVPTGTCQDTSVDRKNGNYYVSGNDPGRLVIVNAKDLTVTGEVPVPTHTDLNAFDPATGQVHLCNDTAAEEWVIDPAARKIVTTIHFDGRGLEGVILDRRHGLMFQAVTGSNTIAVIDAASNAVVHAWSLAPDKGPHGIALAGRNGLLVACNKALLLLDRSTGKILARAEIAPRVDEIAYDARLHLAYCASGQGEISVVRVGPDTLTTVGNVPDQRGTHSIAVDRRTHTVWVASHKGDQCFAQPFMPVR